MAVVRSKIGRFLAIVALVLFILATFMPLPHGPPLLVQFVTQSWRDIGETMDGRSQEKDRRAALDAARLAFYQGFDDRFAGALDYQQAGDIGSSWQEIDLSGRRALLDRQSGMIYSHETGPPLEAWSVEALVIAMSRCRALLPQGFWDMPTGREMDMAHANGILQADPSSARRWLVSIGSFGGHNGPGLKAWSQGSEVAVRCVARSAEAPLHGYINGDNQ